MFITLVALCALIIKGFHLRNGGDYLSKDQCNSIKGLFIALVFICHVSGYLDNLGYVYPGPFEQMFLLIRNSLGQTTVALFMFYSGYGVMRSFQVKGVDYLYSMPRHRLLSTLLNFDVAVFVFLIVDMFIGRFPNTLTIAKALVAWESIGNSNWYIFTILLCYLLFFAAHSVVVLATKDNRHFSAIILLWAALFLGMTTLHYIGQPSWWYDTMLVFGFGATWANFRDKLDKIILQKWPQFVILSAVSCVATRFLPPSGMCGLFGNMYTGSFTVFVLLLTMRICIGNMLLSWMGRELFPIYIFQRLPMLILVTLWPSAVKDHPTIFVVVTAAVTAAIAMVHRAIAIRL